MDARAEVLTSLGADATPAEIRQLAAAHAAGFLDFTLTELRYDQMVADDSAQLRAALSGRRRYLIERFPQSDSRSAG